MEILTGNELMSGATVYLDRGGKPGSRTCSRRASFKDRGRGKELAIAAHQGHRTYQLP
jgi:hypothetical protein